MTDLSTVSLKIRNFKCFGEEEQGFDSLKPINLVIGRNNSGKSALIDLVGYAIDYSEDLSVHSPSNKEPEIIIRTLLEENELIPASAD